MLRFSGFWILTAEFWKSCSCLMVFLGRPVRRPLQKFTLLVIKAWKSFSQVLTGNKTSNSCNVFEMIVCWFSYCFDLTTDLSPLSRITPISLTWFLIVYPLESRYAFTLRTLYLFPNAMTSVFSLFNWRKLLHIQLIISSMHWRRESMGHLEIRLG